MKINSEKKSIKLFAKQLIEKNQDRKNLAEIKRRISSGSLMKDVPDNELEAWNKRISDVIVCPDTQKINCVPNAGTLDEKGLMIMHNGLKIKPLSYYGYPVLNMLLQNKGIHEPQEEYVFQEILKDIPMGATMIELGAYWSFYSMWFNQTIKNARNYMIEPWEIQHGIKNFKLNKLKGDFFQYYIGEKPGIHTDGSKIISVDSFVNDQQIDFVDILHSDIQGSELKMLEGAENLLNNFKVGYLFISTHSDELHYGCAEQLKKKGYIQVCSADMRETYSYDGLLVFKNPNYKGVESVRISHRHN